MSDVAHERRQACILNIEDDEDIARIIRMLLERVGYRVVSVADGREGLRRFHDERPDLVILDVGLPTLDGWTLIERVRDLSAAPILVLTARDSEHDKVRGLRSGADDYLTKPFGNSELVARVEALLRRHAAGGGGTARSGGAGPSGPVAAVPVSPGDGPGQQGVSGGAPAGAAPVGTAVTGAGQPQAGVGAPPVVAGTGARPGWGEGSSRVVNEHGVEVDFDLHIVRAGGAPVDLTPTEFRLLETLISHRGQVLSPEQLLQLAWRDPTATGPDRVKFTVLRLRRKLGWDSGRDNPIETLRGFGYRYRPEVRQ
jgi:DNA-binding response OmpR family regulator